MDMPDMERMIREKLPSFPSKTRRVAEYLLANANSAAFNSISEVADEIEVSKAQLVRVARLLGFSGYSELKDVLRRNVLTQVAPASSIGRGKSASLSAHDGAESAPRTDGADEEGRSDIASDLCRFETANIEETCRKLTPKLTEQFCTAAIRSKTICCMGWGISALAAEWFYTRFTELGLKTMLMRRGSMSLKEQARSLGYGDMLVVYELPSYVIEVNEAVSMMSDSGVFIVTLTDSPAAPICAHADLSFYVSERSPAFGSSLIGPMFACHALTSALAASMGERGRKALDEQREGLSDKRVYYPAYGLKF